MFGGGWTEMLIIGIVALVVIGPKDLPVVMRKVGRVVGTIRRMGGEFQAELNKTTGLDQITDLRRQITEPLRQTSDEIAREFNKITATGVEPTGIVTPSDPKVESVYDQITAASGISPESTVSAAPPEAAPPVMKPLAAVAPEPSPAPVEASPMAGAEPPAKPKRTPRPKVAKAADGESAAKAPAKPRTRSAAAKAPAAASTETVAKPARARTKKA
jgi:sec-independent protein translocase protein TatB